MCALGVLGYFACMQVLASLLKVLALQVPRSTLGGESLSILELINSRTLGKLKYMSQ